MESQAHTPNRFSIRIKEATRKVHSMAEQTTFVRGFLRGTACCESYLLLLNDLLPVYQAMEDQVVRLSEERHPVISLFHFPELFRQEALLKDIAYIQELTGHHDSPQPSSYAMNYANRINELGAHAPDQIVGHLYTRYLGDLSGGQILARIASRSMGLSPKHGLDFYEFPEIENVSSMKTRFRAAMDHMEVLPEADPEAIIEEAIIAFNFNISIFQNLQGNPWKSFLRNLPLLGARAPEIAA